MSVGIHRTPAVMIRKNSYCNHSERGAYTQSVLMSVLRTLRLRGHNPIDVVLDTLASYGQTGKMPTIPNPILRATEKLPPIIIQLRDKDVEPC